MSNIRPASGKSKRKASPGGTAPGGQEKILAALQELGPASAVAISTHTGLAYSTTTAKLRAMAAAGFADRQRHPDGTTTWAPAGIPPADGPAGGKPPGPAAGGRRRKRTTTATADTTGSEGFATGRADAGQANDSDLATPPAAAAAADTTTTPATVVARGATVPEPDSPGRAAEPPRARRAKGQLRAQVLAVLQDHPDDTFKVSQVCKRLPGASAGAIANALDKLVADGNAKQVADKPATYQAE